MIGTLLTSVTSLASSYLEGKTAIQKAEAQIKMKEATGDLQGKEYCMREFWKKLGDNESNKRNISMSFPASPFAIK